MSDSDIGDELENIRPSSAKRAKIVQQSQEEPASSTATKKQFKYTWKLDSNELNFVKLMHHIHNLLKLKT